MKDISVTVIARRTLAWALFLVAPLSMIACGSNSVDSRQLEFNGGLAYVRNHEDPYTGRAIFIDSPPEVVRDFYFTAAQRAFRGYLPGLAAARCDVPFSKGLVEGDIRCDDAQGRRTLEFTIRQERIDGSAMVNVPNDGSRKLAELNWQNGVLVGHQKFYGFRGNPKNIVIDDMKIVNGVKDGREIFRDEDGNVLGDGVWDHGRPTNGSFVDTWQDGSITQILTLKNGVANGKASYYSGGRGPDGQPSTGDYVDGKRSGPWIDYSMHASQVGNTLIQMFPVLGYYPNYGAILNNCDSFRSNWDHGELKGKLECYAKDGMLSLSFEVKDGPIADNVNYRAPKTGAMVQLPAITPDMRPLDGNALPPGPLTDNALETCVSKWTEAFHKESGNEWAPVVSSQLDEWREWCKQGRRPPQA